MPKISSNRIMAQEKFRARQQLLRRKERRIGPKPQINGKHYHQQNRLRALLEKVRPRSMKPQQELGTGVDYVFAGKKIDFKFGFGALGNDTISVRMQNNELLNRSDWTMVCNEKGDIIIFNTDKIRTFVRINRSTMRQNLFLNKGTYTMHKIRLAELLGEIKYYGSIHSEKALLKALKRMNRLENPSLPQKNPFLRAAPMHLQRKRAAQQLASTNFQPRFERRIGQQRNR